MPKTPMTVRDRANNRKTANKTCHMTPVKKNEYNDCGGRNVSDKDDLVCNARTFRMGESVRPRVGIGPVLKHDAERLDANPIEKYVHTPQIDSRSGSRFAVPKALIPRSARCDTPVSCSYAKYDMVHGRRLRGLGC